MHHQYFPLCPIDGPIEPPAPYNYGWTGAIPNKCSSCDMMFEGECTRFMEDLGRYLHLDYGPCGINGPTDPVLVDNNWFKSKVEVPRKCSLCPYLAFDDIRGFTCRKDSEKWGNRGRGLDWGTWEPDSVYLELEPPKVTTRLMAKFANEYNLVEFIKEYRRVNPGLSMAESKKDFEYFQSVIRKYDSDDKV